MGEAVRHIPAAVKDANPGIPWATMAAVRNRVIHGYFGIDDTILSSRPSCPASKLWRASTVPESDSARLAQIPGDAVRSDKRSVVGWG